MINNVVKTNTFDNISIKVLSIIVSFLLGFGVGFALNSFLAG
jgi:hypothetical protein